MPKRNRIRRPRDDQIPLFSFLLLQVHHCINVRAAETRLLIINVNVDAQERCLIQGYAAGYKLVAANLVTLDITLGCACFLADRPNCFGPHIANDLLAG